MSEKAQKLFDDAMQANLIGDTARTADLLKQVVELDPERVDAWIELSKVVTDRDERRMALTTILNLDPNNAYAKNALESVEKPKNADADGDVVPGIPRSQARMVGIGLVAYTILVCGATLLITSAIRGSKEAAKVALQQQFDFQTQTQVAGEATGTQVAVVATQQSVDATATLLAQVSPTPSATPTRGGIQLPTEIPPSATPTTPADGARVLDLPPALPGRILAWIGNDVRSDEFKPLIVFPLSEPGLTERLNGEIGRNPLISQDGSVTLFEQWRRDGTRLIVSSLTAASFDSSLDTLITSLFLVINLRDPSISADNQRVAFIATDYNSKLDMAFLAVITNPSSSNPFDTKFYKLSEDGASYTGITLSPDGTKAVAVRNDGSSTDLVVFDLSNLPAPAAPRQGASAEGEPTLAVPDLGTSQVATAALPPTAAVPAAPPGSIPVRPLTTDGNALVEGSPAFSWDGTKVVYDAASSSTPNNRDLYVITVGTSPSAGVPIMTLDGNDVAPVFSPDGNYVAFASDRETGIYNIYIFDTTSKTTYQLTSDPDAAYPGSWNN